MKKIVALILAALMLAACLQAAALPVKLKTPTSWKL